MSGRIGGPTPSVPRETKAAESVDTTKPAETKSPVETPADHKTKTTVPTDDKAKAGKFAEFALSGLARAALEGRKLITGESSVLPTAGVLKRNDKDKLPKPEVMDLQKQLNEWRAEKGKAPIKEDGVFSPETEKAVLEFQKAHGLSVDGKAGTATQNRLLLENDAAFKKLDTGTKDSVRSLMTKYGYDKEKIKNLREFATSPGLARLAGSPDFAGSTGAVKKSVIDALSSSPPVTTEKLDSTMGLIGSAGFKKLSEPEKIVVLDGLKAAKVNPEYAKNVKTLLDDPKFQALDAKERMAVLSQVRNYPDARSVANIDRLLQKDWFTSQSLGDKQRSLKMVAYLSSYDKGDRKVIDNTLEKFLGAKSDYKLEWKTYKDKAGSTTFGEADDKTLWLNRGILAPGNKKMVENEDTLHLVLSTTPHEVNHLLNGDKVESNFKYFEAEYRAWYVGFKAQHGRPPTNEEAMEQRISWQLDPDSFYGKYAGEALKDPAEAAKFYDFLSKMSGKTVDATNWATVIASDPSTWAKPADPAPVPSGNVDNH